MIIKAQDTACIVVDVQEKLMAAMFNADDVEKNCNKLISGLKLLEVPMIVTQQYTKGIGMTLPSLMENIGPDFKYYDKMSYGVMGDETINAAVAATGKKNVLVCGTEAHVCVLQTCVQLKELGYNPILVVDAIGSRHADDREYGIKRAMQEGVTVTTSEAILFEFMGSAKCPVFKEISKIVK